MVTATVLVLVLLASTVPGMSAARPVEKVKARLSFTPFAAHIPLYVAQARGFFAENGLDVEILSGRGSSFAAQIVGSGNEQFAIADAASVVVAHAKGIPVVSLGNIQQDSGVALFATVQSGITQPRDLKGRKVGIFQGSTTEIFLKAILNKNGLTLNDISPVIVRPGGDLPLVLDGRIEAEVTVFNNELIAWQIQQPQLKLRIWRVSDLGFEVPGYAVITNDSLLRTRPDIVRGFVTATMRALDVAIKNPDGAVDDLVKAVPELNRTIEATKWRAMIRTATSPTTDEKGLGAHDVERWESLVRLLRTYGVIKPEEPVNLNRLLNNQFLPRR